MRKRRCDSEENGNLGRDRNETGGWEGGQDD